jgi:hypothetical protein
MTSQTGKNQRRWRRTVAAGVACSAVAVGIAAAVGMPLASADPATPTTDADAPPEMTADQALAIIASDYDTGAGGGQLSNLVHAVLQMRSLGFKPSNANKQAITKALDYRPNQTPLIEALKSTLTYQRKLQAQMQNANNTPSQGGYNLGGGQYPPGYPTLPPGVPPDPGQGGGVLLGPGGPAINIPVG